MTMDGVLQAPGGPEEDRSEDFAFGGWMFAYREDESMDISDWGFDAQNRELVLGRKTYDIFAAHWPYVTDDPIGPLFDKVTKYVATHRPGSLTWKNTKPLGDDIPGAIAALKREDGPDLLIQGSSELIQTLLAHDLIDRFQLMVMPLVLGPGKKLFGDGAMPAAMKLAFSKVSTTGVVVASYERDGEVQTGSFAMETPTEAELERRKNLA